VVSRRRYSIDVHYALRKKAGKTVMLLRNFESQASRRSAC